MDGKEMDHRRRIGVLYRGRSGYGCYKERHWTLADENTGKLWGEICYDYFASYTCLVNQTNNQFR